MKQWLQTGVSKYFHVWWLPSAISAVVIGSILSVVFFSENHFCDDRNDHSYLYLNVIVITLAGILAAAIYRVFKKRWWSALLQLALVLAVPYAVAMSVKFIHDKLEARLIYKTQHFADSLTIPTNIEVTEPLQGIEDVRSERRDAFSMALLDAMNTPGSEDTTVAANIPSLVELQHSSPDILQRYLATSAAWCVFQRDGLFAERRCMIGESWQIPFAENYGRHEMDAEKKPMKTNFQLKLKLEFSSQKWVDERLARLDTSVIVEGKPITVSVANKSSSNCVLRLDGADIVINEISGASERRVTKAVLRFLEEEFKPLAASPTWETIQRLVPTGSIKVGAPDMVLRYRIRHARHYPGSYSVEGWVNPGEPGLVYLQAYEVTKGARLSKRALKESSNERIGWSSDPTQQFLFNAIFIEIYEGVEKNPYAARFEIWFVPDSGKAERKLFEKVFKVEGYGVDEVTVRGM
ncbi:MAG: hypothetical protein ABI443_00845 [Chthoniobacterales bacterium]